MKAVAAVFAVLAKAADLRVSALATIPHALLRAVSQVSEQIPGLRGGVGEGGG